MPAYRSIRIQMPDRPGALAAVSTALSVQQVNIVRLDVVGYHEGMVVDDLLVSGPDQEHIGRAIGGFQHDVVVRTFDETSGDPALQIADGLVAIARARGRDEALQRLLDSALRIARADSVAIGRACDDGSMMIEPDMEEEPLHITSSEACIGRHVLHRQTAVAFPVPADETLDGVCRVSPCAWVALAPLGAFAVVIFTRTLNIPFLRDELERVAVFTEAAGATLRLRGDIEASGSMRAGQEASLPPGAITLGDVHRAQYA